MFKDGILDNRFIISSNQMDIDYRLRPMELLALVEDNVASLLSRYDIAPFDVQRNGMSWVISDIHIAVSDRIAYWRDELSVRLWVAEKTPLRMYFNYEILTRSEKESEFTQIAKGFICYSVIETASGRPVKSDEMTKDIPVVEIKSLGAHPKVLITPSDKPAGQSSRPVLPTDIDFNIHVNNLNYLNLAVFCQGYEFTRSHYPSTMKLKFLKQTFIPDTLTCQAYEKEDSTYSYFLKNSAGEEVCRVEITWRETEVNPFGIDEHIKRDI